MMHSRLSDPLVLELLLEPTGEQAAGEAEPEADAEESRTPESESERIWKAADNELSVDPMAVNGSELMRRAGGWSESEVGNPKLLLLLAPVLPLLLVVALLVLFVLIELVLPPPTNPVPKSVDQMLG
jgi:hypothetical protein